MLVYSFGDQNVQMGASHPSCASSTCATTLTYTSIDIHIHTHAQISRQTYTYVALCLASCEDPQEHFAGVAGECRNGRARISICAREWQGQQRRCRLCFKKKCDQRRAVQPLRCMSSTAFSSCFIKLRAKTCRQQDIVNGPNAHMPKEYAPIDLCLSCENSSAPPPSP